ncbi:MAG TPA: type II secretion system F family protein [Terracidiphilus sp.]|jgi:tight adherence protein C
MLIAVFAFVVMFLLIVSGGLLVFYRELLPRRISEAIYPREQANLRTSLQNAGQSLGVVVEQFQNLLPKSKAEVSVVRQRLIRAGFRNDSAVKMFYGLKVLVPLLLAILAFATGLADQNPFMVYTMVLALGFLGPDFWLGRRIKARQKKIRRGLPDVLDLLIICIEAGLSLDMATSRTSAELMRAQPDLCDELGIVVLEQRAGRPRQDAWRNLAERTDVDSLRSLVSILIQAEQFGTSIAKTLRIQADTLRTQRVQMVEEQAAKTSTKLVFPLVLFIFPSLFLVVLGPAVILMMESFATITNSH